MDAHTLEEVPVTTSRRAPRARAAARPTPVRSTDYEHLTLPALRAYRAALQSEEANVSYWRRILQARLDVVREGRTTGGTASLDASTLRPVLSDRRVGAGRTALVQVLPIEDAPPLPDLADLWERRIAPEDTEGLTRLVEDLADAEERLSAYRTALHVRLGQATGELIARYHQEPTLCLSSLPLPLPRRAAG